MSKRNKTEVAAAAPAADAPVAQTVQFAGTIQEVKGTFRAGSDRAAWLELAQAHAGRPLQDLYDAAIAIGPSGPSTHAKTEPAATWVKWLVRKGYVQVQA